MKVVLKKRETEIQKLIQQMKSDGIDQSPVFQKLEQELHSVKLRLETKQIQNEDRPGAGH